MLSPVSVTTQSPLFLAAGLSAPRPEPVSHRPRSPRPEQPHEAFVEDWDGWGHPTPVVHPEPSPMKQAASSLERDVFLAGVSAGTMLIPGGFGSALGLATAPLTCLAGFGEVREGMRHDDTREVLDGAMHMGVGIVTLGASLAPNAIVGTWLVSGALGLLATKMLFDHSGDGVMAVLRQGAALVRDAVQAVRNELDSHDSPPA